METVFGNFRKRLDEKKDLEFCSVVMWIRISKELSTDPMKCEEEEIFTVKTPPKKKGERENIYNKKAWHWITNNVIDGCQSFRNMAQFFFVKNFYTDIYFSFYFLLEVRTTDLFFTVTNATSRQRSVTRQSHLILFLWRRPKVILY